MSQVYCTKTSKAGPSRLIALGIVLLFLIGLVPSTTALPTPGFNGEASDAVVGRVFPEALETNDYIGFFEALDGIELLEERYPGWVTYKETGQSYGLNNPTGGRDTFPVFIVEVTNPDSPIAYDDKVQLLFMLSIHGNEKGGREGGLRIIEDFARDMGMAQWTQQNGAGNGTMREYLDFMTLIFLFPNPDGWVHDEPEYLTGTVEADPGAPVPVDPNCGNGVVFYCRTNGRNVDLNREVPTTGWYHEPYSALSEPEAQAFANFVIENYHNLVAATDIHGMLADDNYVLTLMPAGQADPHKMTQSTRMAELLKERLNTDPEFSEYRAADVPGAWGGDVNDWGTVWDTIGYTDSGFNGDWFFQNNGLDVPGYDIELAYNHITFDSQYEFGAYFNHLHIQGTRQIIGSFMDAMAQDLQVAIDVQGTTTAVLANPVVVTNTDDTEPLGGWAAKNPFDDAWDYANNDFYAAPQDYWTELKPYLKDEDAPGVLDELNPVDITAKKLARYTNLVIPGSAIQTIENDTAKIQIIHDWVQAGGHLVLTDSALKYLAKAGVTDETGVDVVNLYAGYSNFFDRSHPLVSPIRGIARQLYEPVPLGFSVRSSAAPNWFVEDSALPDGSTKLGWVPIPQRGDDNGLPWFVPDPEPATEQDTSNINVGEIPLGEGRIRFIGSLLPDPSEEFYHPYGLDSYATTYSGNHLMRLFLDWEQVFEAPPALVTLKGVSYTPPQSVLPNTAGGDKDVDEKESPAIAPLTALLGGGGGVLGGGGGGGGGGGWGKGRRPFPHTPIPVLHHPSHIRHDVPGHPEQPERIGAILRALTEEEGLVTLKTAPPASHETLLGVHPAEHLDRMEHACQKGRPAGPEAWTCKESWPVVLDATGAAIAAADQAATGTPSVALTRPPGHHSGKDFAMGFCLVNHIAVAAHHRTTKGDRVMIVDIDVHHGNGTEDVFWMRDDVLYVSLHQAPFYPGTGAVTDRGLGEGEGHTVNVPLPHATGHDGWLHVAREVVWPLLDRYAPDLVLVSAGFDGHHADPLASLRLSAETYHRFFHDLVARTPNVAAVLEGGYDLDTLARCNLAMCAGMSGKKGPDDPPVAEGADPWPALSKAIGKAHGAQWGLGVAPHAV